MGNDLSLHHSSPKGNFVEENGWWLHSHRVNTMGFWVLGFGFGVSKGTLNRLIGSESQSLHLTLTTSLFHILVCMHDVVWYRSKKLTTTCRQTSWQNLVKAYRSDMKVERENFKGCKSRVKLLRLTFNNRADMMKLIQFVSPLNCLITNFAVSQDYFFRFRCFQASRRLV